MTIIHIPKAEAPKTWSPQQAAFLDWCTSSQGSCVLEAVAGAGKTTTLLEAVARLTSRGSKVALLAYNKKIADEINAKLKATGLGFPMVVAGTVHSFGIKAFRKSYPNVEVDKHKVRDLAEKMLPELHPLAPYRGMAIKLVSLAKQRALGVAGSLDDHTEWQDIADHFDVFASRDENGQQQRPPETQIIEAAIALIRKSSAILDKIDFDDMIYLPLLLKLPFFRYDVVMVDEAQDTNPARRIMVKRLAKDRVIAVGDRHQAIYGFTGADNDSLDLIADDFKAVRLPLTTTYRCPKSVVAFAQQWVSHIHAHETAPEGAVSHSTIDAFYARKDLNGEASVLCRNTKPLVALAFSLIRRKIACKIEGREVGEMLVKLIQRWKVKSLDRLTEKLDAHYDREKAKFLAKRQEARLAVLEDTVETIRVIIDECQAAGKNLLTDAVAHVESLFADDVVGMLTLSTIHKSKGREWERVFWLDRPGTCPSKWAKQQWQQEQEKNLCYVAATRAKAELIELDPPLDDKKKSAPPAAIKLTDDEKSVKRKADKARRARERKERKK